MKKIIGIFIVFFLISGFSHGQVLQYGNIRGTITDSQGIPLPGVTVTMTGPGAAQTVMSSETGVFRFLTLPVGTYEIKAESEGLRTHIQKNIIIDAGRNITLRIQMEPATQPGETIVIEESPVGELVDTSVQEVRQKEKLQEVPSTRDPWSILQQMPGITMDVENVGGSGSGSQGHWDAKGGLSNSANMDGMDISSSHTGGGYMYYDFDSFEQIRVGTAGQDSSIQAAGTYINFIMRRGTNEFTASTRVFYTSKNLQSDNRTQEVLDLGLRGNRINWIADYGVQAAGPIFKDKLWLALGWGQQDIRRWTIKGDPERTRITGRNFKLTGNPIEGSQLSFLWVRNVKKMFNRGISATRPPETAYWQNGPSPAWMIEEEHTFSDNVRATLKFANTDSWFQTVPYGMIPEEIIDVPVGQGAQVGYDQVTGMWFDSHSRGYSFKTKRQLLFNTNIFVENILGGNHEFNIGGDWRMLEYESLSEESGQTRRIFRSGVPYYARVFRLGDQWSHFDRFSGYINDMYTRGKMTVILGLRFDHQKSTTLANEIPASIIAPEILPAISVDAIDPGAVWKDFSPRFALTYDLFGNGKTVLSLSLARYADRMSNTLANHVQAVQECWAEHLWDDADGNGQVTTDELVDYPQGIRNYSGFDPDDPTNQISPNVYDPNMKAPLTDELIFSVKEAITSDISASAEFTLRKNTRLSWTPMIGVSKDDFTGPFTETLTYAGETYSYEYWSLPFRKPAGTLMENQPDYHENYMGLDLGFRKRLSGKWMMSASVTIQKHIGHTGQGYQDPTNLEFTDETTLAMVNRMVKMTFLYRFPLGIDFSIYANAKQGRIVDPIIVVDSPERGDAGLGTTVDLYIQSHGTKRYETFYNCDIRLQKDFFFGKYGRASISAEFFNAFNFAWELGRYSTVNSPRYWQIQQILNPRVVRIGIRYQF